MTAGSITRRWCRSGSEGGSDPSIEALDAAQLTGRVVRSLVTGGAQALAIGELVITTGTERLLVVELLRREAAVSVVRAPTCGALTRTASSLSSEALYRIGKTHVSPKSSNAGPARLGDTAQRWSPIDGIHDWHRFI